MDNIDNINGILKAFKISAECTNFMDFKNAFFYDLELKPGTRLSQLEKYASEIALALKSNSKPRFEVMSAQGIVRCEFVKKRNETIELFKLGRSIPRPEGNLTCLLGETLQGEPIWMDITKNPHMLVAGTTGSGKSSILHSIIANMLLYPNVDLYLIDPKNIEFFKYQSIKKIKVAFNYDDSVDMIESLCVEMDNRYHRIRTENLDISTMNYIVLVIDEFADISLQDTSGRFYMSLCRLAQKSRAAGIHIICATQRPSVNIIDGAIKANFPARLACKVATGVDSRVVLDATGAEALLGAGDAIINSSQYNMVRFQAAFVSADKVCKYLNKQ